MIAVDTNVLVHAHRRDSPFFDPARSALAELAEGGGRWAIPWPVVAEFVCVTTHPKLFDRPSTPDQAVRQIDAWAQSPGLTLLGETATSWSLLRGALVAGRITGPVVYDARTAAICLAHGVRELWTADRDYGRFPALRVRNPLVSG
ncbi:MAG TPA: TA system VapC family ribonuclease toxin [Mycobacteriales bacterium]|nr:TA system VapC family ribonuclease toxin [Mycobacteriales bacterium]